MTNRSLFHLAAITILTLGPALPAGAGPIQPEDVVQAEVLTGWQTPQGTHMAALHLHLADHWKTYWRAPGDAGIPPSFDWSGSSNVASVTFHWPRPTVFDVNGMESVGYTHDLVLPMEFTPKDASQPMQVAGTVAIGVCNDICMPVELHLSAALAAPGAPDPAIRAALAAAPVSAKAAGVTRFNCEVSPIKDGLHVTAHIGLAPDGAAETALFETADPTIWIGATSTARQGDEVVAGADLVPSTSAPFALDRSQMTITILGQSRAVELSGCPAG
ncbi:MAG: hypothetical protein GC186_18410 [Rhodobacteraceae bacterium]|nr:hypothetical protein [Paracoccaceae bacterium]